MKIVIFGADEAVTTHAVPVLLPGTGAPGRGIAAIDHDVATGSLTITMTDGATFQTGDLRPAGLTLSSQQW